MLKIRFPACAVLAILLCLGLTARRTESRSFATRFSSVYTDLSKQCRNALKEVGEGQDMPLKCKGYGGYQIGIGYSAASAHLGVEMGNGDAVVSVMPQPLSYYDNKKVEWRLADGKPFAVIIRVERYRNEGESYDADTYAEKNKTGETLLVKGLKGFEQIDGGIDARTPDANTRARQLADDNYKKQ
jgi:hypothetical protein